uniref:Uncharacterized protein n=1 Tax=Anopheles farauti TaxID=69004 RepID=A0A182Q5Z7_9DIPT
MLLLSLPCTTGGFDRGFDRGISHKISTTLGTERAGCWFPINRSLMLMMILMVALMAAIVAMWLLLPGRSYGAVAPHRISLAQNSFTMSAAFSPIMKTTAFVCDAGMYSSLRKRCCSHPKKGVSCNRAPTSRKLGDSIRATMVPWTHPGQHQELRGSDRTGSQNNFLPRADHVPAAMLDELHAVRELRHRIDQDPRNARVHRNVQIVTVGGRR